MAELMSHRRIPPGDSVMLACNGSNTRVPGYSIPNLEVREEPTNGQMMRTTNGLRSLKRQHTMSESRSSLVFKDVSVVISKKQILNRISGVAKVGETLAIMGPSGAGKSTLLNVLGGRVPPTSGLVTFDGEVVNRKLRRKISYVLQADVFYPNLTLRETLTFALLLRLPDRMPRYLKEKRMQEIVDALELNKCLDTKMGDAFTTGLSGGERKRASIACELLTNPRIIILDEPTSGLDAAIAYSLMATLNRYARQSQKTVVTTIHQPSSQVFYMFSNVLLITDGHIAYYGPGSKVLDFFAGLGLRCAPHYNPADFILEKVKSTPDVVTRIIDGAKALREKSDWPDELKCSNDSKPREIVLKITDRPDVAVEVSESRNESNNDFNELPDRELNGELERKESVWMPVDQRVVSTRETTVDEYVVEGEKWPTGFISQYSVLTRRALLRSKNRYLSKYRIGQMLFVALCVSLVWFQTKRTEAASRDRLGILFFILVFNGFLPMMEGIFCVYDEDGVFVRERASGIYRLSAYYLATTTAELPSSFCIPTVFICIVYWTTGLMPAALNFFGCLLFIVLSVFTAQGVGIFMGVLIRDKLLSTIVGQCFMISSMLAAGFYNTNLPSWISWVKYLSYITYGLHGLGKIEFKYGSGLQCSDPSTTTFPDFCSPPGGGQQGTEAWIKSSTSATVRPEVPGEEFLKEWDMDFTPLFADYLILFGILLAFRIAAYVVLRIRRPGGTQKNPCQVCCHRKKKHETDDDYDVSV